jgi:hypothetical protein
VKTKQRMTKKSKRIWGKNVSGMGSTRIMLRAVQIGIFARQLRAAAVRAKSKASLPTGAVPCVIVEVRPDSKGRDRLSFGLDHTIKGD